MKTTAAAAAAANTAASLLVARRNSSTTDQPVGSTGLTLGALIGIAAGGTAVLVAGISILLLCLCCARRRRRRRHGTLTPGIQVEPSDDAASGGTRTGRRKLQKRNPSAATSRDVSPARKHSLPPVIPPLFTKRSSFNPFSALAGGGGGSSSNNNNTKQNPNERRASLRRQTSNAWVDEDALHGPKVAVPKKPGWRRSIRESWPLRNLSPTLPRLPHYHYQLHKAPPLHHHHNHQLSDIVIPDLPPTIRNQAPWTPPRSLPNPPQGAFMAAGAGAGGADGERRQHLVVPMGQGHLSYENLQVQQFQVSPTSVSPASGSKTPTRPVRPKQLRASSTESSLSEILKFTERRLQDGTMSGVAQRKRLSTSPNKTLALRKSREALGAKSPPDGENGSTAALVSVARTPSPTKTPKTAPSHNRQASQGSILSTPFSDHSFFADASAIAAEVQAGLTSPSRTIRAAGGPDGGGGGHAASPSVTSSLSISSLSTIPSVGYEHEDGTINSTVPTGSARPGDPFVSSASPLQRVQNDWARQAANGIDAPGAPGRSARLRAGTVNQASAPLLRIGSPLSSVAGFARSVEALLLPPVGQYKTFRHQSQHFIDSGIVLARPETGDSPTDETRPKTRGRGDVPVPGLSLTSPSVTSTPRSLRDIMNGTKNNSPSGREKTPVPKRTYELRERSSSPTLGQSTRSREITPDEQIQPSPALSSTSQFLGNMYDSYADMPPSAASSPARRRAGGELRVPSGDSTSHYSEEDRQMSAFKQLSMLLNSDVSAGHGPVSPASVKTVRSRQPVIAPLVAGVAKATSLQVGSTVAELRRMNSQISTAASGYSGASSGDSPPMPTLREREGFNSVRKGAAARNYLALRTPPQKKSAADGGVGSPHDKENERLESFFVDNMGLKIPRIDIGDENITLRAERRPVVPGPLMTPARRRVQQESEYEGRRSEDSLYDRDGFLISPERRKPGLGGQSGLRT